MTFIRKTDLLFSLSHSLSLSWSFEKDVLNTRYHSLLLLFKRLAICVQYPLRTKRWVIEEHHLSNGVYKCVTRSVSVSCLKPINSVRRTHSTIDCKILGVLAQCKTLTCLDLCDKCLIVDEPNGKKNNSEIGITYD